MSKRSSKSKRRSKALPALGFAGVSLSMASGACASTTEASANTPPTSQGQSHEIFLADEEIFDISLSTFYTFDKENAGAPSLAQHLRLARGGCGGCGHGGGCGGSCWIWTPLGLVYSCWGESTPAAKVSDVALEPSAQTAEVTGKR
jgi:hypothetical protein